MIQRVQTIYLFIALILMVLMYFFPFAKIINVQGIVYTFEFDGVKKAADNAYILKTLPTVILLSAICLINFIDIFLYKRRILQMRLCIFSMLLMLGLFGLNYYFLSAAESGIHGTIVYKYPFIFPIIAAILNYLAFRGIRKDELLVKAYERIR